MSIRAATDADYNALSRCLQMKIEIYFDGLQNEPVVVTRNDYLIDAEWLDEASAETSNPLGAVSSNELAFSLFNENGMFSPTNVSGPYYGKIRTNIPVVPYIRPDVDDQKEIEWTKVGLYYVSEWTAAITGITASIVAEDKIQQVFLEPTPFIPVGEHKTQKDFFLEVFDALGYPVSVSPKLNSTLLYTFIEGEPKEFLQEMLQGSVAYCICNKNGDIIVEPLDGSKNVRATLTDADQLISVESAQTLIKSYSGVELTYVQPQLTDITELLRIKQAVIPPGTHEHNKVSFSKGPVKSVSNLCAISNTHEITVTDYVSSPWDITIQTLNIGEASEAELAVYGTAVDFVETALTDSKYNSLKIKNRYIQGYDNAVAYNNILEAFVSSDMPTLTIQVRGNPLLSIGDKVVVQSDKYGLNYTGVIIRLSYKYVGSLSCSMTLLNSSILEVNQ